MRGYRLPMRPFGYGYYHLFDHIVARSLRRLRGEFDIVHCWPSGAFRTLQVARDLGIHCVLERPSAHTRYVLEVMARESERLGVKIPKSHYAGSNPKKLLREEQEFALAETLLCPSDFVVKTFEDQGYPRSKMVRHRYGYDPLLFYQACKTGPRDANRQDMLRLAYIGECSPLKGLHLALRAWIESGAAEHGRFLICGRILPGYRKVVEKYLSHPNVSYLGFTASVPDVLRSCDALVLPSLAEGSALVTYEARACGSALLVSDAAGAVCEHMGDGLVHKAGDWKDLSRHIALLAGDHGLLERLRSNSVAGAAELTWDKASERLVGIYSSLLQQGRL